MHPATVGGGGPPLGGPASLVAGFLLRKELERVEKLAVGEHLVVQVVAGRAAGAADMADHVAAIDLLAGLYLVVEEVSVARLEPEAVVHGDEIAVTAFPADVRDGAGRRREHGLAAFAGNVETRVEVVATRERIGAMAHRRREPALRRPDRRRCRGERITAVDGAADNVEARL